MGTAGLLLTLWGVWTGCAGTSARDVRVESPAEGLPVERLDSTWVVQLAEESAVSKWANDEGWVSLVMKRDYGRAVQQLGRAGGLPAARAHAEAAAMYRESALMMAFSLIEVYGKSPQPSDPVGTRHLLAVSYAIVGDRERAKAASDSLPADDVTAPWHAPWKGWLADPASKWPPDLSHLPVTLPPPAVGEWPQPTDFLPYEMQELDGSTSKRTMADPGLLLAMAEWHRAASHVAAPDAVATVDSLRAGYYLPAEPQPAPAGDLPFELLFGSDQLVAGDAAFLADLHGAMGAAAVDAHAATSLLAEIARRSRVDGKVEVQTALDITARLRQDLVDRSAARTGGNTLGHHRIFSDIAFAGTLRGLALVAEVERDREVSGLFRINALEHSEKHTACPVGMLALGAWDASNRYPLRAQEILHGQIKRYPSLEIARYGLDVLGLRVNSESVSTPGM
jgi:hypothetical protein